MSMSRRIALTAIVLCGLSAAENTALDNKNNIDPSDIAALPTPSELGPPVGATSADISFDASAVTASVLREVTAVTDAQATSITVTSSSPSVAAPTPNAKRSQAELEVVKRALQYPIDTHSFPIPSGYTPAFQSLSGSTQARGYLTYKTLSAYDPLACAAACNQISSCMFFNIYYERDPDSNNKPVDVIKCALYSMPQTNATATNVGQYRGSFQVIIGGSNGYNKASTPVAPAGYTLESLPAAINAPTNDRIGQKTFMQPIYIDKYDPALCAAACDKQTELNKASSSDGCNFRACVYANMYILSEDGAPQTTICALYTQYWNSTYAVHTGYSTSAHYYQVSNSVGITNTTAASIYPKTCGPPPPPEKIRRAIRQGGPGSFGQRDRYFGFYGNPVAGAFAKASKDQPSPDKFIYYKTPEGDGYIYNYESGLCLTITPPMRTGPPGSRFTLATCDTSEESAPRHQNFRSVFDLPNLLHMVGLSGYSEYVDYVTRYPSGEPQIATTGITTEDGESGYLYLSY